MRQMRWSYWITGRRSIQTDQSGELAHSWSRYKHLEFRIYRRLYKPETISQQPYDHSLRARRKILHQTLSKTALSTYWHAMSGQALAYLQRLLEDPENFVEHIRRCGIDIA
jgi:hypothetical protein